MSTYVIEFLSFWHEYFRGSQHVIDGKGVKWHVIEIKRLSLILASGTFLRRRVVKHEPPELYRKIQAPVWFRLRRVRERSADVGPFKIVGFCAEAVQSGHRRKGAAP